ncbi:uncharacterized [Tachysurus ichikawai]
MPLIESKLSAMDHKSTRFIVAKLKLEVECLLEKCYCHCTVTILFHPELLLDQLILRVDAQINTSEEFTALCLWVKQEQDSCHNASLSLRNNSPLYTE